MLLLILLLLTEMLNKMRHISYTVKVCVSVLRNFKNYIVIFSKGFL
jgi:hypothetical protein